MKTRFILLIILIGFSPVLRAADPISAANVKWMGHFGVSEASRSGFCLMARGFFQMPTSPTMPEIIAAWIREHPKAIVVPVASSGPITDQNPAAKMLYVWIVDGEHNLNLELVRQGCFAPQTQTIGNNQKLEAPQADYEAFVQKAMEAGQAAKEKKIGVWKESSE